MINPVNPETILSILSIDLYPTEDPPTNPVAAGCDRLSEDPSPCNHPEARLSFRRAFQKEYTMDKSLKEQSDDWQKLEKKQNGERLIGQKDRKELEREQDKERLVRAEERRLLEIQQNKERLVRAEERRILEIQQDKERLVRAEERRQIDLQQIRDLQQRQEVRRKEDEAKNKREG
jgi:hypothetical protein